MPRQPNKRKIGIFMVTSVAVLLLILGGLLQNKIFGHKGREVVMFFEESVNGLSVGSAVVFKGVKIGEVSRIEIKANPEDLTFSIPVYANMTAKSINSNSFLSSEKKVLDALVKRGLRARLATHSFVTGQLMVELVMMPQSEVKLHEDAEVLEVPTVLSPIGELSRGLQKVPLAEGFKNFTEFFDSLNKMMPEINRIVADIEGMVQRNKGVTVQVLDNFNKMTVNVAKAAKSMQNLTDYLERHPEALIKGKK